MDTSEIEATRRGWHTLSNVLQSLAIFVGITLQLASTHSWGIAESVQPANGSPQWSVQDWDTWSCPDCSTRAPKSPTPDTACRYWLDSPVSSTNAAKNGAMYDYLGVSMLADGVAHCLLKYRHIDIQTYTWAYDFGPKIICPMATPPYTFKPLTGMCERDIPCLPPNIINSNNGQCEQQETYTIKIDQKSADLQPARATDQQADTFKVFRVTVTSNLNGVKANTPVTLRAEVTANSGGHQHDDTHRPKGYLYSDQANTSCDSVQPAACITGNTDGNGEFLFAFMASEVAGEHTVAATCDLCKGNKDDLRIKVAVPELVSLDATSTDYVLVGGTGTHPAGSNHYLTPEAKAVIEDLARRYREAFPNDPLLHLNDASLIEGGALDICTGNETTVGCVPYCTLQLSGKYTCAWSEPHTEHRRGKVIDVRANNLDSNAGNYATSIPKKNEELFIEIARDIGLDLGYPHSQNSSNRHWHIKLLGVGQ